jgi:hypothetical protein
MLDKLLKFSGTATLYTCTSLFLAGLILGVYLKYAWQIDHEKWVKILAAAQGLELANIQEEVQKRIAEINYDTVLERRAARIRDEEFLRRSVEQNVAVTPPVEVPQPQPETKTSKPEDDREKRFEKKVKDYLDQAKSAGLSEETRLLEAMEPEQAKEVIRKLWKDGAVERVLTMLLAMEEKNRGEILYSMQQNEELKDLCDILQRIGNGEPLSAAVEKIADETRGTKENNGQ